MLFHQISLSPQYLDLRSIKCEILENWTLWKEKYCNNYLVWSGKPEVSTRHVQGRYWWRWPLSIQSLKPCWRRRCTRLPCSNGEDEKLLHRRSNVRRLLSRREKLPISKRSTTWLLKWKEPWQRAAVYVIFFGFYTILWSAFDWSCIKQKQSTSSHSGWQTPR